MPMHLEIMPLSIYSANKFFFYLTWLGFVMPHVDVLVTVLFLTLSVSLWYNFFKTWKGDPGLIKVTEDQRFRAIVELAERSNDKNPFDQRVFCVTFDCFDNKSFCQTKWTFNTSRGKFSKGVKLCCLSGKHG